MGLKLESIGSDEANAILTGAHYLGPADYRPEFSLTTETRDALACFSAPVAAHFKRSLDHPLELTRLWRSEDYLGQLSEFVAASLRWLKKNVPDVDCVFSYADPAARNSVTGRRHSGGVYTGANFAFLGETRRGTDQWRTETGETVSAPRVTRLLGTKSRDKVAVLRPEWQLIEGKPKLLYVFPLRLSVVQVIERIGEIGRYKATKPSPNPWD